MSHGARCWKATTVRADAGAPAPRHSGPGELRRRDQQRGGRPRSSPGRARGAPADERPVQRRDPDGGHAAALGDLIEVPAVRLRQALARDQAAHEREGDVVEDAEQHQRHGEEARIGHRERAQHEAAELAADVGHEDARAGVVERQEAGEPAGQQRAARRGQSGRESDKPDAGQQARPGRQPVQPVDEVHRVGDVDQPCHRERHGEPAELDPEPRHADPAHHEPARDHDRRAGDLGAELDGERPGPHVVEEGDHGDADRRRNRGRERHGQARDRDPRRECRHDAHAAPLRHRPVVRLPRARATGVRHIHQPGRDHATHDGGRQQRQRWQQQEGREHARAHTGHAAAGQPVARARRAWAIQGRHVQPALGQPHPRERRDRRRARRPRGAGRALGGRPWRRPAAPAVVHRGRRDHAAAGRACRSACRSSTGGSRAWRICWAWSAAASSARRCSRPC